MVTFEEYVLARGPALVRFARLLAGDRHRGEDLAQEVLAAAYTKWRRISATDRPDLYLRRMVVNAQASWWRRRSSSERPSADLGDRADVAGADSDHAHVHAERDALWPLLVALPARQRAVLVLRYYEDLDDTSIATVLDCAPVTVRTHALRALTTLRGRLGADHAVSLRSLP